MATAPKLTDRQLNAISIYLSGLLGFEVQFVNQEQGRNTDALYLSTEKIVATNANAGIFKNIIRKFYVSARLWYTEPDAEKDKVWPFQEWHGTVYIDYDHVGNGGGRNGHETLIGLYIKVSNESAEDFEVGVKIAPAYHSKFDAGKEWALA